MILLYTVTIILGVVAVAGLLHLLRMNFNSKDSIDIDETKK